jgi:PAS domain S-box-containing protein
MERRTFMEKRPSPQTGRGGYLEALLNSCPHAVIAINSEGIITFVNKEAVRLIERQMHELVGQSIVTMYDSLEAARETNRKLYASGGIVHDHESTLKTKTGKSIPVRVSASHLKDSSGNYIGAVGYFQVYRPWPTAEAKVKAYAEELEAKLEEWKDLGAPVYELYPGLTTVVVVGRLDASRIERIRSNLLSHLRGHKTAVIRIDLSAALLDDAPCVASELLKTVRIARLLGAESILTGIDSCLAEALEPLVEDLNLVKVFGSRDAALQAALNVIGFEIRKKD